MPPEQHAKHLQEELDALYATVELKLRALSVGPSLERVQALHRLKESQMWAVEAVKVAGPSASMQLVQRDF